MVLPKKLFSLLTAQSLVKSEKSEETSVIRDFPFCFIVTMYVRSRLCIRTYVEVTFCICTYVEVTFCWSRYFFCVFLFGAGLDSSRVSLPVSSGVGGGGGCLHITVLVHFVNSAGLSRIYNNTSASGSASAQCPGLACFAGSIYTAVIITAMLFGAKNCFTTIYLLAKPASKCVNVLCSITHIYTPHSATLPDIHNCRT